GGCIFHPQTHAKYGRLIEPIGFLCPSCIIRLGTIAAAERDEEHGWAVIATERAQRAEAERDALRHALDLASAFGPTDLPETWTEAILRIAAERDALRAERDDLAAWSEFAHDLGTIA